MMTSVRAIAPCTGSSETTSNFAPETIRSAALHFLFILR